MAIRSSRAAAALSTTPKVKVLIADDHPVVRQGLRSLIEKTNDLSVVAEAATAADTLHYAREAAWDVMVLNLTFPDGHGLDVLTTVKAARPHAGILVFSMHVDSQLALRALRGGASGYISKDSTSDVVLEAIRKTAAGRRFVSQWLAEQLVLAANGGDLQSPPHARLSEREFQVMLRLATGQRVGNIADALSLSVKTISTYRSRVLEKLGVSTNAELAGYAIRNQLLG